MKKAVYIASAVAIGAVVLLFVYNFQASRLTPERLRETREARERVAQLEQDAANAAAENAREEETPVPETTPPVVVEEVPEPVPEETPEPVAEPSFKVRFDCSCGSFTVAVHEDWAPIGARRFRELVDAEFFDGCRFFRAMSGFMAQFGISGDPEVTKKWTGKNLQDDPVKQSNTRGRITFANTGRPNSRSAQMFINFGDNSNLDGRGFAPFGEVIEGMEAVDAINTAHGQEPNQERIRLEGNAYLKQAYPDLDFIKRARIVEIADEAPANQQ
ncbi:MAG: peptidylprolyl isomerase [bacterium]|nr:peptidylprolyl isomerase [bacterium]